MSNNFLKILVLLTFFVGTKSVIGAAPGPEEWRDDASHLAPAVVRKAADNLWNAVKLDGAAAFDAGYGVRKKECNCWRVFTGLLCCFGECVLCCKDFDKFVYEADADRGRSGVLYQQRTKEVMTALQEFKDIINRSVSRPEQYSGDANVCDLGPWVEDYAWEKSPGGYKFTSARRNLGGVTGSVKAFVNAHGGWAPEPEEKVFVIRAVS